MILNSISDLQKAVLNDLGNFHPEAVLCAGVVVLLLLRLLPSFDRLHLGWAALVITGVSLYLTVTQWQSLVVLPERAPMFSGLLIYDAFTVYLRLFLLSFVMLVIWLTLLTGIPDREDS